VKRYNHPRARHTGGSEPLRSGTGAGSSLFPQLLLDTHDELIVDLFAGGGGASSGIEQALGRQVDIAINHDAAAVSLHQANHQLTRHHVSDVFEVDPRVVTEGRPVGFLWASPDCTFHSKARGGKPIRSKTRKRRALAWVVTRWAGQVRPRVIVLENVEEFAQWGPLVGKPDALRPCPKRRGRTFKRWVKSLTDLGYKVEWRELRACDYGTPTIRKRLFLIARCDGQDIVWPEPTHGPGRKQPYRTAAECIDWSIPMLSIFATKEEAKAWGKAHGQAAPIRPLAANTERRIARGVKRYVLDNPRPYLVTLNHGGSWQRAWDLDEPMRTVTSARDAHAVVSPVVVRSGQQGGNGAYSNSPADPLTTITTKAEHSIVAPLIVKNNHGDKPHTAIDEPLRTVVAGGTHHAVVAPCMVPRYGERDGQVPRARSVEDPMPTVVNSGNGGSLVAASVSSFYGGPGGDGRGIDLTEPLRTQGCENRFGLVSSFLATNAGGFAADNSGDGRPVEGPTATITGKGANHSLVGVSLIKQRGTSTDADPQDPLDTVSAGGMHHGVAAAFLDQNNNGWDNRAGRTMEEPNGTVCAQGSRQSVVAAHIQRDFGQSVGNVADAPIGTVTGNGQGKAGLVASFLSTYYGTGIGQEVTDPLRTVPTIDNFGFVTVAIDGQTYVLADIAMRMLQPKELYAAQGFRPGYIIDRGADGRMLTKTEQVRMCGNSVCPPVAEALVRANVPEMIARPEIVRKAKPVRREVALAS